MANLRNLQQVFQTLSDYNRLVMIKSISDKECSVGELVKTTKLSQPLVSHHLRVLKITEYSRQSEMAHSFITSCGMLKFCMQLIYSLKYLKTQI